MERHAVLLVGLVALAGGCHLLFPLAPSSTDRRSDRPSDARRDENRADDRQLDAPRADARPDAPRVDGKPEGPRADRGKLDAPKLDAPKPDAPKPDAPKPDLLKPDLLKPDATLAPDTGGGPAALWYKTAGDTGNDSGWSVASGAGLVCVAGYFEGTITLAGGADPSKGLTDAFVVCYDTTTGKAKWGHAMGGTYFDSARGVAVDSAGNVYVTGRFQESVSFGGPLRPSVGADDGFVVKFDAAGNYLWDKTFGATGSDQGDAVAVSPDGSKVCMAATASGAISLPGYTGTPKGGLDLLLGCTDTAGASTGFATAYGSTGNDSAAGIAFDSSGNIYLAGTIAGPASLGGSPTTSFGLSDIALASYTSSGVHRWSSSFGGVGQDASHGLTVAPTGQVYLVGEFTSSVDFGTGPITAPPGASGFVAAFTPAGAGLWSKPIGGPPSAAYAVTADSSGNANVTGSFQGSASFGATVLTAEALDDVFVASFTASWGAPRWARRFGGTGIDRGRGIAMVGAALAVAGDFTSIVMDFGTAKFASSAGSSDVFLVWLQ